MVSLAEQTTIDENEEVIEEIDEDEEGIKYLVIHTGSRNLGKQVADIYQQKAINNLPKLANCEAHATYMVENGDKKALKRLKINLTCEPKFASDVEIETQ